MKTFHSQTFLYLPMAARVDKKYNS